MNTKDIDRFVYSDKACRLMLRVFSVDTLPERLCLLVCHTDPSDEPGKHWIAIFLNSKTKENFSINSGRNLAAFWRSACKNAATIASVLGDYFRRSLAAIAAFTAVSTSCLSVERFRSYIRIVDLFTEEPVLTIRLCEVLSAVVGLLSNKEIHQRPPASEDTMSAAQNQTESHTESHRNAEELVDTHQ
jgi:hypothetical protein